MHENAAAANGSIQFSEKKIHVGLPRTGMKGEVHQLAERHEYFGQTEEEFHAKEDWKKRKAFARVAREGLELYIVGLLLNDRCRWW